MYGACKFLGICSGHDSPDSDRWRKKTWIHPELSGLAHPDYDGTQYLTNTRIGIFQACRRMHQLDYLIGIERADAEDRDALVFGHLMHEALAAWWGAQNERKNHGDANSSPAIDVGTATTQMVAE
jgi:hypothetical protein